MVSTLRYLSQKPRQSIVRTQEHGLTKSAMASEPKQPITKIFEPQGERSMANIQWYTVPYMITDIHHGK
jgi:hypothetical protein